MIPMQQTAVYPWDNPANYKPCKKKQYEIWVCKPPQGTVVINTLEQADAVKFAGGRTFFTAREINSDPKVAAGVQQLLQAGKAYLVKDDQTFVLCGTQGEMWCISSQKLGQKYVWASDDSVINAQTFKERAYIHSNPVKGTTTLLDWTKVRTVPDNSTAFACFVPANMQGQIQTSWAMLNINGVGVPHGKGDFVIAGNANGQPNLNDRYVVNGAVFGDTYDNRGWAECLAPSKTGHNNIQLPNLMGKVLEKHAQTNVDFDRQKVFATYKKAASIADSHGYAAKEARLVSSGSDPREKELYARLNSEDFACIRVNNDNCCYDNIYVLFPDMSVYTVEARNVSAPFGSVDSKKVLQSQSDVRAFFNKVRVNEIIHSSRTEQ